MKLREGVHVGNILFIGQMIRALLEGRKTLTRRVMNPQPIGRRNDWSHDIEHGDRYVDMVGQVWRAHESTGRWKAAAGVLSKSIVPCPYGKPGDLLWVRETWRIYNWAPDDAEFSIKYEADGNVRSVVVPKEIDADGRTFMRYWRESCDDLIAEGFVWNDDDEEWQDAHDEQTSLGPDVPTRRRPSIFMPRWASRLTLRITNVRVERLQDISAHDASAEGATPSIPAVQENYNPSAWQIAGFFELWDSLNAKRAPVISNPWVWVIEFEVIAKNVDVVLAEAA